jgi:transcriptional pleiotropic regulator of transition state genes
MREIGIVRKVDHLGRIVLPKELRDTMNIQAQDGVEIYVKDDTIVLQKHHPSCIFCDSRDRLYHYKEKSVCERCLKEAQSQVS